MAGARAAEPPPHPDCAEILASASVPNIHIKLSGFHYVAAHLLGIPVLRHARVVRRLYEAFGPERLCWGSDYPVVRFHMTYRQALEAFRAHCAFVPERTRRRILGGNLHRLLEQT